VPEDDSSNLLIAGWIEGEFWFGKRDSRNIFACTNKSKKQHILFVRTLVPDVQNRVSPNTVTQKHLRKSCFGST
jgi:hypothetical protein